MKNAALSGKPYAGNPHVRFDEGEVASYPPTVGRPEVVATRGAKPRRGSLLYNIRLLLGAAAAAVSLVCAESAFGADRTWNGNAGDGVFTNRLNWSGEAVPENGDKGAFNAVNVTLVATNGPLVESSRTWVSARDEMKNL